MRKEKTLLIASLIIALAYWTLTIRQPLIKGHEFRQTQTALSALFMQPGLSGFLNYQTPVVGFPWSIPFEFPLFQWLASGLSRLTSIDLSTCGRTLSVIFGLGCIGPALGLLQNFNVSKSGRNCFLILYFSSSIYLYWNRTFMIESMALFFTLLSLYIYSLVRPSGDHVRSRKKTLLLLIGFCLALSLSLLIKATTGLPAFLLIFLDLAWKSISALRSSRESIKVFFCEIAPIALVALTAFALLKAWTFHADSLKALNPVGTKLTSEALKKWNFGTTEQRLSSQLWLDVVIRRMLSPIGALPAIALLISGFRNTRQREQATFMGACLFLAITPLLLFSNLHIAHTYYQSANQVYILLCLSTAYASSTTVESPKRLQRMAGIAILLFILGSYVQFFANSPQGAFAQSSDILEASKIINKQTEPDEAIIIFDDDWSSSFAYHSQRRALTLPTWSIEGMDEISILQDPTKFLGNTHLGAVATKHPISQAALTKGCPKPELHTLKDWKIYICHL